MSTLDFFQRLGEVLQLPITVLPVAALLLRFGQPDLLNVASIAQAGGAAFDNLALIFTIGVASSWSRDSAGAAALASAVGYFVLTEAMVTIDPETNMGVLAGIITGSVGGTTYNRWSDVKLPDFLGFFGGKRFVLIATGFFCLVLAAIFDYVWPPVQHAIHVGNEWIVPASALGSGIFGFINRLLIPIGLYQVLNTITWFQTGEFTSVAGTAFHGDINRFYVGDGTAEMFMPSLFPTMMFGLPGATLAMYSTVPKERRLIADRVLPSVAVTAFLTGVIEPLEFLFTFLVSLLYLLHALLTGIDLFVATLLGIHADFSFSAEAIDYALMYNLPAASQNVWMLLMVGAVFFATYFVVFSLVIHMSSLKTLGREDKEDEIVTEETNSNTEKGLGQLTTNYIATVGGTDNLKAIDACVTRLRLTVVDLARVNDATCKRLGASGVVRLNKQTIQVTAGAKAESIGGTMKKVVAHGPIATVLTETTPAAVTPVAKPQAIPDAVSIAGLISPITGDVVALDRVPDKAFVNKAVNDGVAAKPAGKIVVSPTIGTVVRIPNTNHTFCLETEKGAEIAVHTGIGTVVLEGKGFKRLVEEGAQASTGQPILEMGLDCLNVNTRSVTSPVVCSNIDDFNGLIIKAQGHVVAGQTPLYEVKR